MSMVRGNYGLPALDRNLKICYNQEYKEMLIRHWIKCTDSQ